MLMLAGVEAIVALPATTCPPVGRASTATPAANTQAGASKIASAKQRSANWHRACRLSILLNVVISL